MQLVTLTTDWGNSDFFAGMVKGKLYSLIPDLQVVDITHSIEPYNLRKAAFVLKNTCFNYPQGTIHIVDVDTYETKDRPFVVIQCEGQYFICADNGVAGPVFCEKEHKIYQISTYHDSNFFTFVAYNLFVLVAAQIASGTPMEEIGYPRESLKPYTKRMYMQYPDRLVLYVMYIDGYGNAYLNIPYNEFVQHRNGRKMRITAGTVVRKEIQLSNSYNTSVDFGDGAFVLTVSASGYLELAIRHDNLSNLLSIEVDSKVTISFE